MQDYIFSSIQQTGFYWSESLLYNTFWVFFIPFTIFINRLVKIINSDSKLGKMPLNLMVGVGFSFVHILMFTAFFVWVSKLVFTPAHYFSHIFNTALSNQFYIALLWYAIFPAIYISKYKTIVAAATFPEKLKLKIGSKIIAVPTASIQFISTDKPYSIVYANDQKFLDNKSLKEFEALLDTKTFIRVHRSTIINTTYIKELKSRSNGDYDAVLENGQSIRLSRHYRNNWNQLLQ